MDLIAGSHKSYMTLLEKIDAIKASNERLRDQAEQLRFASIGSAPGYKAQNFTAVTGLNEIGKSPSSQKRRKKPPKCGKREMRRNNVAKISTTRRNFLRTSSVVFNSSAWVSVSSHRS
jgi:hypothetical protein